MKKLPIVPDVVMVKRFVVYVGAVSGSESVLHNFYSAIIRSTKIKGVKRMSGYDLIDKPFQDNIAYFGDSVTKRKILKYFDEERSKLMRQLYKDDVHTDEQFLSYAADLYQRLKPLLMHAYQEEYPDKNPTINSMESWIQDCAISSNLKGRTKERNIWSKLWKFYVMLVDDNLIPADDRGYLI